MKNKKSFCQNSNIGKFHFIHAIYSSRLDYDVIN